MNNKTATITAISVAAGILAILSYIVLEPAAFAIVINLLFGFFMFFGYMYLSFLMIGEAVRPKDWLTPLRWRIFAILFIALLTLIPSLTYQLLRLYGIDSPDIRNIVTITSRFNGAATLALLFTIFFYRRKEQ